MKNLPAIRRDFCFQMAEPGLPERGQMKTKIQMSEANERFFI
jgi:hypothetical protein